MLTLDSAPGRTTPRKPFRLSCHARLRTHAGDVLGGDRGGSGVCRVVYVAAAEIHAIEGRRCSVSQRGIDLRRFEASRWVCRPGAGVVLTVYRNRDSGPPSLSSPRVAGQEVHPVIGGENWVVAV